jgi:hypothetical protein
VIKKISLMAMFNLILLISFYSLTMETSQVHEYAHKEIAENHGCTQWEIRQKLTGGGEFECFKYATNDYEIRKQEQTLHSINEIVSYNVSSILSGIAILTTALMNMFFIMWINKNDT